MTVALDAKKSVAPDLLAETRTPLSGAEGGLSVSHRMVPGLAEA